MSLGELFALSWATAAFVMVAVWLCARKINNYSIVDPAWTFCFIGLNILFVAGAPERHLRGWLILAMVTAWAVRLGYMLARRIAKEHPKEDGRYKHLREGYEPNVGRGFFWFYQIQAASVVLLSVPFLLISQNQSDDMGVLEWMGVGIWLISFLGEALADHQMTRFKRKPENRGKTCEVGLWAYSRHPNYFFEACMWFAYYLIALNSTYGVYTLYAPLFMLYILTCVTGVPPSEAQALRSRGDEFRAYQARVSVFVPWFRKRSTP